MHRTIVIEFSTLDGIIEDPDGSGGTPNGGWAFRHGPEAVAGAKFHLGTTLDSLNVIQRLVFQRRELTLAELAAAVAADFPDERLRRRVLAIPGR